MHQVNQLKKITIKNDHVRNCCFFYKHTKEATFIILRCTYLVEYKLAKGQLREIEDFIDRGQKSLFLGGLNHHHKHKFDHSVIVIIRSGSLRGSYKKTSIPLLHGFNGHHCLSQLWSAGDQWVSSCPPGLSHSTLDI